MSIQKDKHISTFERALRHIPTSLLIAAGGAAIAGGLGIGAFHIAEGHPSPAAAVETAGLIAGGTAVGLVGLAELQATTTEDLE